MSWRERRATKAPKKRTTRLDRRIARQARKQGKRAKLAAMRRTPVSGGRLLLVMLIVIVLAAAWWVNSLFQVGKPHPSATGSHSAAPSSSSPASAETTPGATPPEEKPALDREDPEAVARAWAAAYLQREEPFGTAWMDALYEYTYAPVVSQLRLQAFGPEQILDGKAPTALRAVEIGGPAPNAEKNTPVRWSHTVTAHVAGADGTVTVITFGMVMTHTREGWEITSVEEISVTGGTP